MSKKSTKIVAVAGVVAGLGVAALPALTFATTSVAGQVNVKAEVSEAIAMTITGNADETGEGVDVYLPDGAAVIDGHTARNLYVSTSLESSSSKATLLPNAADTTSATSDVTVYTNAANGYKLSVKDADSELALVNVDDNSAKIPAGATITAGTAAWGYKVASATDFTAITASDAVLKTTNAPTSNGDTTAMVYGISTASTQKTGLYTDTIVYTATTNE